MAGLCGVKILLLWAGIIGLGKCDLPSRAATATTTVASNQASPPQPETPTSDQASSPQPKTPTSDQASSPQPKTPTSDQASSPQPKTPTSDQASSPQPKTPTSDQASSPGPAAYTRISKVQCSYTVNRIQFGIRIDINSSAINNASIEINEEGKPETKQSITVTHFTQTSSHPIKQLKPCTIYNTHVKVHHSSQTTSCNIIGNDIRTFAIVEEDIKDVGERDKSVCYQTGWNINSISVQPNRSVVKGGDSICVKPNNADLCSKLTLTFTSQSCNNSFTFTRNITLDYLDPKKLNTTFLNKLPTTIHTEKPPNCNNLSINYTCQEKKKLNGSKKLSEGELEPFTNYSCTGHIKHNNVTINKTTEVSVRIDCDLDITVTKIIPDKTSLELNWKTTSKNCNTTILKLWYEGKCHPSTSAWPSTSCSSSGETCKVSNLTPFTNYNCTVTAKYNNFDIKKSTTRDEKTKTGVPDKVTDLTLRVGEHNTITVTCKLQKANFYGDDQRYKARLFYNGTNQLVIKEESQSCTFNFKNLYYSTSYKVEVVAVNSEHESKPVIKSISTDYNDKAVIGFLVFLIIVTSVALLLVIYKIFVLKRRKSHELSENMMLISTANDEENLMPVEPIAAEVLLEAYKRKLADEGRLFLAEFQSIPRIFSRHAVKEAKKPCNVPKNRYVDILPYDYNRVQLTTGNGEAGCDYINASFIDGYKEAKKYIAAQGPKEETVSDFWRMIWEQQSSIIVMVTRCEEGNRVKCAQYWPSPERETEIFDEFILKLNSEEYCPDYTIRHLIITNKREKTSEREVTHIQFMSWPDHGVPAEPHLLLKLRRRVNSFKNFFSGPIVLHCSAGVGRTGTYIGIDAMMEALEAEGRVDIYGYMVRLRRQRCLMVQVEAQYILIHQALVEHNQFGETEIPLSELHNILRSLKLKGSESDLTLMKEEFDRLPTFLNWRTFNTGISEENREKNRSSSVIPYDYNRVLLKLDEGLSRDSDVGEDDEEESSDEEDEESSRYINASHINGYWGPRALIAAQTPLPDTMADFWLMVFQKKVSTIVMLSEENKESDTVYWDKDKRTFGDLEVEVASTDANPTFITRHLLIRHVRRTESRSVRQFQFLKWVNKELPETPQCLADMMKEIKNSSGGNASQTTLVHCNDGSSRSGVFCALWNLMDSAHTEKLVDVFQVVKTLRKERQNMISSLEQYQFLYETIQMVFPVQNGEAKAVQASPVDSMQIISETKAAEQPDSAASSKQQEAAESTQLVIEEEKREEPDKDSQLMEDTSNSSTVPLEI